jgi:hypothetical protein
MIRFFRDLREDSMTRFVVGDDRSQSTLFPECLEDYLAEDTPVRAVDVFVDELDLAELGFNGVEPEATGRPAYHPATLSKIYVYGYLNRVHALSLALSRLRSNCAVMSRGETFRQASSAIA